MVGVLAITGLILLVGFFGNLWYSKTKIPETLFLLIAGIIIGPWLGILSSAEMLSISKIFTTIALVIVLMEGGINLDLFGFVKNINKSFAFTFLSSAITIVLSFAAMKALGFGSTLSVLFSISIAGTTSITVIHLVEKFRLPESLKEILILESIITDVLLITTAVIIAQVLRLSNVALKSVLSVVFSQVSIAFFVGILAGFVWVYFLAMLKKHELMYISTLGVLFIIYDFVEYIGGNGPIAVLTFSMFIGNITRLEEKIKGKTMFSRIKHSLINSIKSVEREFSFFIKTFFFVYIGTLVNLSESLSFMASAIIITAAIMASRYIATHIFSLFDQNFRRFKTLITYTIPRGFSSILIMLLFVSENIMPSSMTNLTVLVIFFTTLVSVFGRFAQSFRSRRP